MLPDLSPVIVYFDGSCPLCRAEVALYRKQDASSQLCFRDVSDAGFPTESDLSRARAMERFHVRQSDGRLLSGAAAFVSIWRILPRWQWVARAASFPGMLLLLEGCYRLFLPARPILARMLGKLQSTVFKTSSARVSPPHDIPGD